jgi:hypothetical protein
MAINILLGENRVSRLPWHFGVPIHEKSFLPVMSGLWIRIRIRSGFNGVSGSGTRFGIRIRIQGQEKEENENKS